MVSTAAAVRLVKPKCAELVLPLDPDLPLRMHICVHKEHIGVRKRNPPLDPEHICVMMSTSVCERGTHAWGDARNPV